MKMKKYILSIMCTLLMAVGLNAAPNDNKKMVITKPNMERIKAETTNPASKNYYPKLMKLFLQNDTAMTKEEFTYLYYGYLFQEDYDPYRHTYDQEELKKMDPLYHKSKHSKTECRSIMEFARTALADNPLDLRQLNYLIYSYERLDKVNLARIWQFKLNHLLLVIASSGTGADPANAWTVVLPQHEYDFLNLSGLSAVGQKYEPPYYDYISVTPKKEGDATGYYFEIKNILEEYYRKHPSEASE
jgi:hypothetical protein